MISSLLAVNPFDYIIFGNSNEYISVCLNVEGITQFQYNYYDENGFQVFVENKEIYNTKKGQEIKLEIEKEYEKVIIEVINNDDTVGEATLFLKEIRQGKDIEVLVSDNELFEEIDMKYIYEEGNKPSEIIELGNHYKFKSFNDYLLPKIIELDKLTLELDSYIDKGYNECYLLLNHGLKGSDFSKSEEDFYKVPLECKIVNNIMNFQLAKDYYYDFNSCVMKEKKSNNSVKVNDIILSKNDFLLTEGYLVIDKFGFYQKRFQLDLLLEEKPLFGKNGYYKIKKFD